MSLYAEFIQEREGFSILEDDDSFVTYRLQGDECYARDIYISPRIRGDKLSFLLGRQVYEKAKDAGCKHFISSVWVDDPGKYRSVAMLTRFGMKMLKEENGLLYFIKEIE